MDELDLSTVNEAGWINMATSLFRHPLASTCHPLAIQRRSEKKTFLTRLELENRQKVGQQVSLFLCTPIGFRRLFRSPVPSDPERLCRLGVSSFFRPLKSSDKLLGQIKMLIRRWYFHDGKEIGGFSVRLRGIANAGAGWTG